MKQQGIEIIGFGKNVGEKVVTNAMLEKIVDTNDEWIVQRTGIKERTVTNQSTAKLASIALENACKNANISLEKLDLLVVSTTSSEHIMPPTSGVILKELGVQKQIPAFDINVACSGFVFALDIARSSMMDGSYEYVAVIGVEKYSQYIDWTDRQTCILFGDGAGCVILQKSKVGKISEAYLKNKLDINSSLHLEATIQSNCPFFEQPKVEQTYMKMTGQEVFKFAVTVIPDAMSKLLEQLDITVDTIDYFVLHQANSRILDFVAKKYKVPQEKFFMNLDIYGNTGAASIPLALADMEERNLLKSGTKLILVGFGGGLSWGSIYIEIP
ncbi:3-oxoacyl-[acyl-carrier-protein] synthase III [Erysipelotrichaceae bacterium]|nr:3-oxoacyl-[acyl-carrier-protein] synthase III [Erysipelotrichaceae bacterium]